MSHHVSRKQFEKLVEQALADLPEQFAEILEELTIEIRDRPTTKQLASVGLSDDQLLLGLYHGRPITEQSVSDSGVLPGIIYIFQEDVETASDSKDQLIDEVRTTVLHEIGHHFGLDEDDLDALGFG